LAKYIHSSQCCRALKVYTYFDCFPPHRSGTVFIVLTAPEPQVTPPASLMHKRTKVRKHSGRSPHLLFSMSHSIVACICGEDVFFGSLATHYLYSRNHPKCEECGQGFLNAIHLEQVRTVAVVLFMVYTDPSGSIGGERTELIVSLWPTLVDPRGNRTKRRRRPCALLQPHQPSLSVCMRNNSALSRLKSREHGLLWGSVPGGTVVRAMSSRGPASVSPLRHQLQSVLIPA
jgi:hypothetical protein